MAKRDPAWEEATLKRAVQVLDTALNSSAASANALADLRTLGTNAAGTELARRYRTIVDWDVFDEVMLRGLFTVADRRFVAAELKKELTRFARSTSSRN